MADPPASPRVSSADVLFAKLRDVLASFEISDFAVYALDEDVARLAFSCGAASPLQVVGDGQLLLADHPCLTELIRGDKPYLISDGDPTSLDDLAGARAGFRMAFGGQLLGFVLIYSDFPVGPPGVRLAKEMAAPISLFAGTYARRRAVDSMRRDFDRTQSKLRELQEGLGILLLRDRKQITQTILQRMLRVLGSSSGVLYLQHEGEWLVEQSIGAPPLEGGGQDLICLVARSAMENRPVVVNALSGEETWNFDVETIHMAAFAIFPLRSGERVMGALVGFEATVSLDVVDIVESAALVGGTAIENWLNSERMLAQQRLEEQLALAAQTQQRLLPEPGPRLRDLSVAHYSHYCEQAGGDYVDTIPLGEPYLNAFVVGDVAGHGVGAAMLMVDVRARLRTLLGARTLWSPGDVLRQINEVLWHESAPEEFVTLFLCVVDSRTGVLHYASAGHEPPLLYKPVQGTWQLLESTGLPLGVAEDEGFAVVSTPLAPGDILVLLTDGATEAANCDGDTLGVKAIQEVVEATCGAEADAMLHSLVRRSVDHCGGESFADDVTYLVVRVNRVTLQIRDKPPALDGTPCYEAQHSCSLEQKDGCLQMLRSFLERNVPGHDLLGFFVALEEALANVVNHANHNDESKPFGVRLWIDDPWIEVAIEHDGECFDPRKSIPKILDQETVERERGRGLLIMASLLDELVFWNEGRSVYLAKSLTPHGPR